MHNHENACAALSAVKVIAPEVTNQQIAEGLAAFHGLPHRLKFVREVNGVKYYDDSIATTPGSAIAAIRAFSEPKVIILGGSDKGADYTELVELCRETETTVIAIGQTGKRIMQLCSLLGVPCERATSMMDAVSIAQCSLEQEGGVAILSPASASFDMFKNYADRGDQFIEAVQSLQ